MIAAVGISICKKIRYTKNGVSVFFGYPKIILKCSRSGMLG